jgi:uncharacterized membrane protein (DUF4010 family)
MNIDESLLIGLAVALGSGLLIGIERERRKGSGAGRGFAGVRTFTIAALAGALAQASGQPWLVAVAGLAVLIVIGISYWRDRSRDPGVTTELALFVTFLLGVTAIERPALAGGIAVVVATMLVARTKLHRFSTEILTQTELRDALILAGAVLVVLPLIPSHPLSWLGGINPRSLWRLVVLMMALQAAGYIALRLMGPRLGLPLSGLAAGFVSSTATVAAMGTRARKEPHLLSACVAGALFSSIATTIQLAIVAAAIYPSILISLAPLLITGLLLSLAVAALSLSVRHPKSEMQTPRGSAFNLIHAIVFAVLLSGVTALVSWANQLWGEKAISIAVALAGFADVHSAAASVFSLAAGGRIENSATLLPLLIAFSTNTISKIVGAMITGGTKYAARVAAGLLITTVAMWLVYLFL